VETAEEAGLTQLAQICMTKGAGGLSAADLDDALEDLGAKLRPFASRDVCGFGLGVVREHFLEGLDLFGRVLTDPAFLPDTVARERDRMKAQLAALRDDTVSYTVTKLFRMLYGEHAYGRPVLGTEPSLDALDAAALRAWHGEAYDASRLVIAVVGDADREATLARLETILGRLPRGSAARIIPAPVFPERGSRSDFGKDVSQAVVVLGYPGPEHRSEDRYALDVWNATMSGMGNRLFTRLRDEKHLCYFTGSFAQPLTGGGVLGAYVGTGPDQVEDAIAALIGELERGAREPATDEEILRAKNTLAGGHLIDMQTRMAWAGTYARDEVLGLGYGETERYLREIRLVTAEEARSAAARYVDPGRLTVAVLQPEANAPAPADV
jgi:zinc protease